MSTPGFTWDPNTSEAVPQARHVIAPGDGEQALLSIVIPAFNEEASLGVMIERTLAVREQLHRWTRTIRDIEVIVVDDGSTDGTAEVAKKDPRIVVIRHDTNRGYGRALKTGCEAARGAYLGFIDADGTYPPEAFPRLCRALERQQADVVIGSRLRGAASAMPAIRYVGNRLFAQLLSWITGQRITDTASGMRVFRRGLLPGLRSLPDGLELTPAMSTWALHEGLKVVEVPIPYRERVGLSKLHVVSDGLRFFNTIVGIARLYNPLKFFGAAGLFLLAVGGWLAVDPIAYYLQARRVEDTEIYRLVTIMILFVTGLNLMSFGAVANYVVEFVHGKPPGRRGLLGRLLLGRHMLNRWGWLGACLMLAAPLLNHRTIIEYLTTGRIFVHWAYILTGCALFLIGLQLLMGSILIGILQAITVYRRLGGARAHRAP